MGRAKAPPPDVVHYRRQEPAPWGPRPVHGQRLPTAEEVDEAHLDRCREQPRGAFPESRRFEVTPESAQRWLRGLGRALEGLESRTTVDLFGDERALLIADLLCWERYGPRNPDQTLADYLRPGREHWGWLGVLADAWAVAHKQGIDLAEMISGGAEAHLVSLALAVRSEVRGDAPE